MGTICVAWFINPVWQTLAAPMPIGSQCLIYNYYWQPAYIGRVESKAPRNAGVLVK